MSSDVVLTWPLPHTTLKGKYKLFPQRKLIFYQWALSADLPIALQAGVGSAARSNEPLLTEPVPSSRLPTPTSI